MTEWLHLSDRDRPVTGQRGGHLDNGLLVIELALPLPQGVLLDWHGEGAQGFSVFFHADGGLSLLWRSGSRLARHVLPGVLPTESRLARMVFRWDCTESTWTLRLDDAEDTALGSTYGLAPPGFPDRALADLCAGRGLRYRHPSVMWYGVCSGGPLPRRMPWIGQATPVPTLTGPVPAGRLQPGDWILTRDAGPVQLASLRKTDMPSRGTHAAILLRAPFFARDTDLLVSADQLVVVEGLEAEYLFGKDQVMVSAGALVDGRTALADDRRPVTTGISLDLGALHLIDIGGCSVMTAHHGRIATRPILPLHALPDHEAVPLMQLFRRMRPPLAA